MNFRLASNATRSTLAARFVGPTKALQSPQAANASTNRAAPAMETDSLHRCAPHSALLRPGRRDMALGGGFNKALGRRTFEQNWQRQRHVLSARL